MHTSSPKRKSRKSNKLPVKNAEDLSEGELEGAMDELGIQAQEPTDEEIAMLEAGNEPDEKSATQAASQGTTDKSYLDELERLASFRDQGIITQEEFDAKKVDLLDQLFGVD